MRRLIPVCTLAVVALVTPTLVQAQSKELQGTMETVKGTVEAIDHAKHVLTMKASDGTFHTVDLPREGKRFSEIKIGDAIMVRYYSNVVIRKKAPGEAAVDTAGAGLTPAAGSASPAGTAAKQRTITATIEAIDPAVPSITFTGPNGWKYSRRVTDTKALAQVKVGDRVDITWTEAAQVEIGGK